MKHVYLVGILWSPDYYGSFSDWVLYLIGSGFRSDACACGQVLMLCSILVILLLFRPWKRLSDSSLHTWPIKGLLLLPVSETSWLPCLLEMGSVPGPHLLWAEMP